MTNVPHILAIPERQASASARRVLAAHLGPRAAQRRQEPSAGAGLRTDECELEPFASGHLQYGFAVTLLDFHRDALKPCETCFCCCFAALSPLKQLLATVCEGGSRGVAPCVLGNAVAACPVTRSTRRFSGT